MKKITIYKWLSSNWFTTFASTLLGVYLGVHFSNYNENRKIEENRKLAFISITEELTRNKTMLAEYNFLEVKFDPTVYLFSKLNKDFEIVIPKDSIENFVQKTKEVFEYTGAQAKENNYVKVEGQFNLETNSKLIGIDLSHTVWDAYKQTQYFNLTNFNCIAEVGAMYELINKFNKGNTEFKEIFYKGAFIKNEYVRSQFMENWRSLLAQKNMLESYLAASDEIINKNCSYK